MFLEKFKALVPKYLDDEWTPEEGLSAEELQQLLADSELPTAMELPLVLEEFYRPSFHRQFVTSVAALDAQLQPWLDRYNTRRRNHGDFMP